MNKNNARLPDLDTLIQAGINPKNGLPYKMGEMGIDLKTEIRKKLRVQDEQIAVNRYKWENLPDEIDEQLLERILYYKGQGAFFKLQDEKFYFLPYALNGTIDVYGRFTDITPLPFNGKSTPDEKEAPWIEGLTRHVIYDLNDEVGEDEYQNCVLLSDYTKQISQTNIPRATLQDPILDAIAEAFPMARTNLIANSGIKGMRVSDQDQEANVKAASRSITRAALTGDPWIPIVGTVDFQDLTLNSGFASQEYLMYMQALQNFASQSYGIANNGVFEKKAHTLQSENDMNSQNCALIYTDSLKLRKRFCDLINKQFGLNVSVRKPEELNTQEMQEESEGLSVKENFTTTDGGDDGSVE